MQWLTAVLAFATTMLIFSVIVSSIVEVIHRIVGLRSKGLALMLENLYTRVIKDMVPDCPLTPHQFAMRIMHNRAINAKGPFDIENGKVIEDAYKSRRGWPVRILDWLLESHKINNIPVELFTQKLAETDLLKYTEKLTDEMIKDVAQKYEALGEEFSIYFERRARLISVLVAMFVAFAFYIHPYNLATSYIGNPALAQQVADKAEEAYRDYGNIAVRLDTIAQANEVTAESTASLRKAIEDLHKEISAGEDQARLLEDAGVPVGWPDKGQVRQCASEKPKSDGIVAGFCLAKIWKWDVIVPIGDNIFWLILGGLLVGLGAPFWARAVTQITATRSITNKLQQVISPAHPVQADHVIRSVAAASSEPALPVKTFSVSKNATPKQKKPGAE